MTPTPEMEAMAERIAQGQDWGISPREAGRRAALAAIIETSTKAAEYLEVDDGRSLHRTSARNIHNGEHLK